MTSFTLPQAITLCEREIALNESANVDKLGRLILDRLNAEFRRWLAMARREEASTIGMKWLFGKNYLGPSLDDAIRSSEFHRGTAEGLMGMFEEAAE